ncbi:MAG: FliA/WhiG family RNA polymerase sigma factor [Planctomycetes bacterium]|nr:FliA/WhiG family RNA polymerase sigma factor [Planctomycetota bacterium]
MADATTNPADSPQTSTEELWVELKRTNDDEIRHEIVRRHQPLVRFLAEHMASKLPRSVDVDDLAQEGSFGLMDAINKFDPDRGIKFKTYCSTRIRGAILDSLRSQDWVPRLTRQRAVKIQKFVADFIEDQGREPSIKEIASTLEIPEKAVKNAQPLAINQASDRRPQPNEDYDNSLDSIGESKEDNPFDVVNRKDLVAVITDQLGDKERSILQMYYIQGLTLREIGSALSITESRVCQIHSNVIKRLRTKLKGDADKFSA